MRLKLTTVRALGLGLIFTSPIVMGRAEALPQVMYPVRMHGFSPLAIRADVKRFLSDCNAKVENIR